MDTPWEPDQPDEPDPGISDVMQSTVSVDLPRMPVTRQPRSGSSYSAPRGFHWLEPDQLAGCPKPGIVNDIQYDMEALERVGVTHLVTLTEGRLDPEAFENVDIESIFFPIVDMEAPTIESSFEMCSQVDALLEDEKVITYHCKAGIGRTGTMLAAQLVWWGAEADEAVEYARSIHPKWIQSEAQVGFLQQLEQAARDEFER